NWPTEAERRLAARATFEDLLRLPSSEILVSAFALENDSIVRPSPFVEELPGAGLTIARATPAEAEFVSTESRGLAAAGLGSTVAGASMFASSSSAGVGVSVGLGAASTLLTVPALEAPADEDERRAWAALRASRSDAHDRAYHGWTGALAPRAYSVTS